MVAGNPCVYAIPMNWSSPTLCLALHGANLHVLTLYFQLPKNVISYLNDHEAIWVDLLYSMYGKVNFWTDSIPPNCSWFFRGLWYNANIIKLQLWLFHFNPAHTI